MDKPGSPNGQTEQGVVESFEAFMQGEAEEVFGPLNSWVTGEEVGHDPTEYELLDHYIKSGAAERYRQNRQTDHTTTT